jgi:IclR family acetate operon transcriptional repressor
MMNPETDSRCATETHMDRTVKRTPRTTVPEAKALARNPKYYSRAVGKALEVLDILRSNPQPLSFNELLKRVRLVKSSLFRILYTLETAGYVRKTAGGLYEISFDIGAMVERQFMSRLIEIASPWMAQLSREFRETISLGMLRSNHIEVVHVVESVELVRMSSIPGRILPPHASSLGKSITAFQPEEVRERLVRNYGLSPFTANTITDHDRLREEYLRIRSLGYSTDMEETTPDGCCFGVPIFNRDETVLSGLSVSLPKIRLGDRQPKLVAGLQAASRAISKALAAS